MGKVEKGELREDKFDKEKGENERKFRTRSFQKSTLSLL